jgi:hypothetical protein
MLSLHPRCRRRTAVHADTEGREARPRITHRFNQQLSSGSPLKPSFLHHGDTALENA